MKSLVLFLCGILVIFVAFTVNAPPGVVDDTKDNISIFQESSFIAMPAVLRGTAVEVVIKGPEFVVNTIDEDITTIYEPETPVLSSYLELSQITRISTMPSIVDDWSNTMVSDNLKEEGFLPKKLKIRRGYDYPKIFRFNPNSKKISKQYNRYKKQFSFGSNI